MMGNDAPQVPRSQVIADYRLREGTEEVVLGHLARLAAASRTEPANISYEFFRDAEDPAHVVVLERYVDAAGFDAHLKSEHFETIGKTEIIPRLATRTVRVYEGTGERP
ncbi:putative quinol monooxygenase [Streptomyces acidiscabies]|uniref:Quinol monooxygenase n=1 Tax=Streptomyces acidiscabies TaxID=42234 RepID=A0AAP6BLN3_9ACTN|nr:putative quinol monooxygenase [Streptomyces acidiscabies]MBZ3916361.1 antibiotic biosynthesis monooxygenase [Streptomyces acidiscabies]MDX2967059.1 putative quinol monooxygenase [Streptomyces acidiscabies]MDX3796912.1 putative quinol monooxygenase [Streptomyces acidiscabies]